MIKKSFAIYTMLVFCLLAVSISAQEKDVLMQVITEEMNRSFDILKKQEEFPPYFMSYRITDTTSANITAVNGALVDNNVGRNRLLDINLRVGNYEFDNTRLYNRPGFGSIALPIEDNADALRNEIWQNMDSIYNSAVEQLRRAKQNKETSLPSEFKTADFSKESTVKSIDKKVSLNIDRDLWKNKIRSYSKILKKYPAIFFSNVNLRANGVNNYFINTEGASIRHGTTSVRLSIFAATKAKDGMNLFKFESFESPLINGLPDDKKIIATIEKAAKQLNDLRKAPLLEPYTGPAILSGRASGVFFHEIFGHRIEGHRQKSEFEGNTFTAKLEQNVLPSIFSVFDDPTLKRYGKKDLSGHYIYDDEGIKATRVPLVHNGLLKTFLMSRSPIEGVKNSNGHGRAQPGAPPVSRQGNLIIEAKKTHTKAKLRKMLLEEVKRQKKPFGLFFDDISGGFTNTSRFSTQAFQVTPVVVYKIFTDGRPDELVRGLDLIGTPLTVFSKIIAADDSPEVFNGVCGAESGWVPVSAASPGILVSQIEVQKRAKSRETLPLLPPPGVDPKVWKEVIE